MEAVVRTEVLPCATSRYSGDRPPADRAGAAPRRRRPGDRVGGDHRAGLRCGSRPRPGAPAAHRPSPRTGTTTRSSWSRGWSPGAANAVQGVRSTSAQVWPPPESPYPPRVIWTRPADDADQPVSLIFGSCREATPHATGRRLPPGRAGRVRPAADGRPAATPSWPDLIVLLGDQVYADKPIAEGQAVPAAAPRGRARDAPGGRGGVVRRVHEAVPGVVARPGGALAVRHRAERDDLRRPRDHRRLEHLGVLAADVPRSSPGGASGSQRPGLVLGLPAPGQPAPGRGGRRPAVPEDHRRRGRHRRCCTTSGGLGGPSRDIDGEHRPAVPVELRPRPGPHPPGHAGQPLQPGARPRAPGDAAARRSGTGSSTRRTATTTTWWSARRCPGCCRRPSTTSRPGTNGWPTRAGPRRAALAERIRRAVDLEHWAAFHRSFDALAELFRRLGAGGRAVRPATAVRRRRRRTRHRPRSACSPATCTTRTSPGPTSPDARDHPVHQLTCSPIHNQVPAVDAAADAVRLVPPGRAGAAAGAGPVPPGCDRPVLRWRRLAGPVLRQRGQHPAARRPARPR